MKEENNTQKTPASEVPSGPFVASLIFKKAPSPPEALHARLFGTPFAFVTTTPSGLASYAAKRLATTASDLKETLYIIPEEDDKALEELFDEPTRAHFKDDVFAWKRHEHLSVKDALHLVLLAATVQVNDFPLRPRKVERWHPEEVDEAKVAPKLPNTLFPWLEAKTPDGSDLFMLLMDNRFGGGESKNEQFLRSCLHSIWSIAYPGPHDVEQEFTDRQRRKDLHEMLWVIEPSLQIAIDLPAAIAYIREAEAQEKEAMSEIERLVQLAEELKGEKTKSEIVAAMLPKTVFADSEHDYAIASLEIEPGKVTLTGKAAVHLLWDHLILLWRTNEFLDKDVEALEDMLDEAKHRQRSLSKSVRERG